VDAIHHTSRLTDAERIDRLRLIRSDNIGPRGIMAQTLQRGGSDSPRGFGRVDFNRRLCLGISRFLSRGDERAGLSHRLYG
jgi:hypothetical protein